MLAYYRLVRVFITMGIAVAFKEELVRRNWPRTGAVTLKKGLHLFCRTRKHNKNPDREQWSVMYGRN